MLLNIKHDPTTTVYIALVFCFTDKRTGWKVNFVQTLDEFSFKTRQCFVQVLNVLLGNGVKRNVEAYTRI
jgi:hypothetical protein